MARTQARRSSREYATGKVGPRTAARTRARIRRHIRVRKNISGTTARPRLVVNRSATWAGWDLELLALELRDLEQATYDLARSLRPGAEPGSGLRLARFRIHARGAGWTGAYWLQVSRADHLGQRPACAGEHPLLVRA